jgi:group II intron reverse transcriptase/maturase
VDIDLEKFFDRVNHDLLMGRLAKRIGDKRFLSLIRRYLKTGVMVCGVVMERHEGTPQGGPLSPLLSNILLDELDKELEKRGHRFSRYADDCNIYVRSKRAGERVMESVKRFLLRCLRLKVNEEKSRVARAWERQFLGFSYTLKGARLRIAPKSLKQVRAVIRIYTRRNRGCALDQVVADLNRYLMGWVAYYQISETPSVLEHLEKWIRHRIRCFKMKQWKTRCSTWRRELRKLGLPDWQAVRIAGSRLGWWRLAGSPQAHQALGPSFFARLGLISLLQRYWALQAT